MLRTAPAGSVNSGEKTVDATIYTGSGFLTGVLIISDDTNDPQVILYDNTAASGTKIFEMKIDVSVEGFGRMVSVRDAYFATGIHLDINGTGASCILYYRPTQN